MGCWRVTIPPGMMRLGRMEAEIMSAKTFPWVVAAVFLVGVAATAGPASSGDCPDWNSKGFFKRATVPEVESCLADDNADPNARDKQYGFTPLHLTAAYNEDPEVTKALLKADADPNARDNFSQTPLQAAARLNKNPEGRHNTGEGRRGAGSAGREVRLYPASLGCRGQREPGGRQGVAESRRGVGSAGQEQRYPASCGRPGQPESGGRHGAGA